MGKGGWGGGSQVSNETRCRQPVQCDIWRLNGGKLGWCQVPNTHGKIANDSFFSFLSEKCFTRPIFPVLPPHTHTPQKGWHGAATGYPKGKAHLEKTWPVSAPFLKLSQLCSCKSDTELALSATQALLGCSELLPHHGSPRYRGSSL